MNTANTPSIFCDSNSQQHHRRQEQSTRPSMASPSFGMVLQVPVQVGNKGTDDEGSDSAAPTLSPVTVDSSNTASNTSQSESDPFKKNLFSGADGSLSPHFNKLHTQSSSTTTQQRSDQANNEVNGKDNETMLQEENAFFETKADEIRLCLNGTTIYTPKSPHTKRKCLGQRPGYDSSPRSIVGEDEKVVDLWHLRQLALSRGGLLDASNRKRAWLKLVNANEHILSSSVGLPSEDSDHKGSLVGEGISTQVTTLSDDEINLIQHDIRNCIWDIEAGINHSRSARELQRRTKHSTRVYGYGSSAKMNEDASIASFASGMSCSTPGGKITPQLIPESIRAFPRDLAKVEREAFQSPLRDDESGASTPASNMTPSIKPAGVLYSPRRRKKCCTKEERSLLLNIITSVLRTVPEELKCERGGGFRLHYFQGMHNVAAPILINLESPSLTSLVLKRLSTYHLRDAMAPTFMNLQVGIRAFFMPLLENVDPSLHDQLLSKGITDPCTFTLPWILCWFANDIANCHIISRLFDVFLASHASCPIYMSVALLSSACNRSRIEEAMEKQPEAMRTALYNLPTTMIENMGSVEAANVFEDIIEAALSFMRSFPPDKVISLARHYSDERVSSSVYILDNVSMTKEPPAWALRSSAPTDWALIREARTMRDLSPISRMARQMSRKEKLSVAEERCSSSTSLAFQYHLALDASGLEEGTKLSIRNRNRKVSHRMRDILVVCVLILLCACFTAHLQFDSIGFSTDTKNIQVGPDIHNFTMQISWSPKEDEELRIARNTADKARLRHIWKRIVERRRENFDTGESVLDPTNSMNASEENRIVEELPQVGTIRNASDKARLRRIWKRIVEKKRQGTINQVNFKLDPTNRIDASEEYHINEEMPQEVAIKNTSKKARLRRIWKRIVEKKRQDNIEQVDFKLDSTKSTDATEEYYLIVETSQEATMKNTIEQARLRRIWKRIIERSEKMTRGGRNLIHPIEDIREERDQNSAIAHVDQSVVRDVAFTSQYEDIGVIKTVGREQLKGWKAVRYMIREYVIEDPDLFIMVM